MLSVVQIGVPGEVFGDLRTMSLSGMDYLAFRRGHVLDRRTVQRALRINGLAVPSQSLDPTAAAIELLK